MMVRQLTRFAEIRYRYDVPMTDVKKDAEGSVCTIKPKFICFPSLYFCSL